MNDYGAFWDRKQGCGQDTSTYTGGGVRSSFCRPLGASRKNDVSLGQGLGMCMPKELTKGQPWKQRLSSTLSSRRTRCSVISSPDLQHGLNLSITPQINHILKRPLDPTHPGSNIAYSDL